MKYGSIDDLADDRYIKGHCYSNNDKPIDIKSLELMFLYINEYKLFQNTEINLNARYNINFKDGQLYINKNENFVDLFGEDINLKIFCGKNGTGKTTIINILRDIDKISPKHCILVLKDKNNKFITNKRGLNIIVEDYLSPTTCNTAMDDSFNIASLSMSLSKQNNVLYCTKRKLIHNYMLYPHLYNKDERNPIFDHFEIRFWDFEENINKILSEILSLEKRSAYDAYPEDLYKHFQLNPVQYIFFKKANSEFYETFKPDDCSLPEFISDVNLERYIDNMFDKFRSEIGLNDRDYSEMNEELVTLIYQTPYLINSDLKDKNIPIFREYKLNEKKYLKIMDNFESLVKEIFKLMSYHSFFEDNFLLDKCDNYLIEMYYLKPFKLQGLNRIYAKNYSEGEYSRIKMVTDLVTAIYDDGSENTILLNDEIDAHIHPDWAKNYIYEYLNIIKENNIYLEKRTNKKIYNSKKFNIVLTTHSPFILSDVTNDYIEYLEKDGMFGNIKKDKSSIPQTFAGNILQMFANNFFLDSTMGIYSKKVLQEVISFLSNEKINNAIILFSNMNKEDKLKKCREIINLVGDDILRKILQEKLKRFENNETN